MISVLIADEKRLSHATQLLSDPNLQFFEHISTNASCYDKLCRKTKDRCVMWFNFEWTGNGAAPDQKVG